MDYWHMIPAKAAHCTKCGAKTWRGYVRPDTEVWHALFPDPTSVYAVLETPEGLAVGLGYCAGCAPAIGDPGPLDVTVNNGRPLGPTVVAGLQRAPERYQYWYGPKYGAWLTAWTRELSTEFRMPEATWVPLLAQWEEDRRVAA